MNFPLPGALRPVDARALHQRLLRRVASHFGARAHASIGITGGGVFGDEPRWEDPEELRRDAGAARAAGIRDIAIFSLEGILGRRRPERWLDAVVDAEPREPEPTARASAAWRHD